MEFESNLSESYLTRVLGSTQTCPAMWLSTPNERASSQCHISFRCLKCS